jgi:copper transport protein
MAETVVIAVVVAIASILVQTPPARSAAARPPRSDQQSATLTSSLYHLQVDLLPGTVGPNDVHLIAYTPPGDRADVKEWRATATPPDGQTEPLTVDLITLSPSHAVGVVSLPRAGTWTLAFTLRTSEIDQATVRATFDIRPE